MKNFAAFLEMTDYTNRPAPEKLTYAEAWAEYQENGEAWRAEHSRVIKELQAAGVQGFKAVVDAGPIVAKTDVAKRQDALGQWHEFFESHEQHNQVFGYPVGHPLAK